MSPTLQNLKTDAWKQLRRDQRNAAIKQLDSAISQHPNRGDLWLARAITQYAEARWEQALVDIETAMILLPLPIAGQLVLAECYANCDYRSLALTAYEHLLAQGPLPSDIYASVYSGFKKCGREDLALTTCREAIKHEPENDAAYFGMAHCMANLGYASNYVASILKQAIKIQPRNSAYRVSLSVQLICCGELQEAYKELEQTSKESLKSVDCFCSARKLLKLCVWAEDSDRCQFLCQHIAAIELGNKKIKNRESGAA